MLLRDNHRLRGDLLVLRWISLPRGRQIRLRDTFHGLFILGLVRVVMFVLAYLLRCICLGGPDRARIANKAYIISATFGSPGTVVLPIASAD